MKIGIYGGTFDPIHVGHIKCAEEIKQEFNLDKILFVPNGNPMHKIFSRVVPGALRLEMIRLALEGTDGLKASDIEVTRNGYSYTVDTLSELSKTGDELYYIVGTDVLDTMENWKDFDKVVGLTKFIAVKRPGLSDKAYAAAKARVAKLGAVVSDSVSKNLIEASSTYIRGLAAKGDKKIYDFVPKKVADFILKNDFYDETKPVPEDQIVIHLKEILSDEKFRHSLGVSKEAERLAKIYGADVYRCHLAGLLHDCAKNVTPDQLTKWLGYSLEDFGDGTAYNGINRRVVHGPVGKLVAERRFGIRDNVILDAIANHVTGAPEMSLESCIVFISDYTEENREGEVFDDIRSVLEKDGLYAAIVRACDLTTALVAKRGEQMAVQMVYTRNWAVAQRLNGW